MNRLSRTVDAAIRINLGTCHHLLAGIVGVLSVVAPIGTGLVGIRIGIHDTTLMGIVLHLEDILALLVGNTLVGVIIRIGAVVPDAQMSTRDGLSCTGADHHIALVIVRVLGFTNDEDIRDEI